MRNIDIQRFKENEGRDDNGWVGHNLKNHVNHISKAKEEVNGITFWHGSKPTRRETLLYFKDKSLKILEYSNDRYDSGVRVKSAYRLYMPIYQRVMNSSI